MVLPYLLVGVLLVTGRDSENPPVADRDARWQQNLESGGDFHEEEMREPRPAVERMMVSFMPKPDGWVQNRWSRVLTLEELPGRTAPDASVTVKP